jgi:hypothetical protein
VVAGAVVVAAVAVSLHLTPIDHRRTELLRHRVFLGAAYSLAASAPPMRNLEASLPMWGLCRSAPSALRVSFASTSNRAVLALRAYNLKGEP